MKLAKSLNLIKMPEEQLSGAGVGSSFQNLSGVLFAGRSRSLFTPTGFLILSFLLSS